MEKLLFEALKLLLEYHDKNAPNKRARFEAPEICQARYVIARAEIENKKRN